MQAELEAREVQVEFLETSDGTVYVGYQTHLNDTTRLFTELRTVVTTILGRKPGSAIAGATFHTQQPVIATWRVDGDWAEGYGDGSLSEVALMRKVLGELDPMSFE